MTPDPLALPLLDFMAHKVGCDYLSDLPRTSKAKLLWVLEQIPAEAAGVREWNDALEYLADQPPERTAEGAREKLISCLTV